MRIHELFPVSVFETMICLVNVRMKNQYYGKSVGFQLESLGF